MPGSRSARSEGGHGGHRTAKLQKTPSRGVRSDGIAGSVGRTSSSRSKNSTERLIEARRANSVGSATSSKSQNRDASLRAYIRRARKIAASCDAALEQQKAYFQSVPEELTELQGQMVGVLTLVKELEGKGATCTRVHARAHSQTPTNGDKHHIMLPSHRCALVTGQAT